MSHTVYPYSTRIIRTADWYDSGGQWYKLSTWCDQCLGTGDWNYYNNEFVFTELKYKQWFDLRWL